MKLGFPACSCCRVSPAAKPVTNEAFAAAATAAWLSATSGDSGANPTWKGFSRGELFNNESAIVAGNMSENNPNPPRTTVFLPEPNGLQAKPTRGCQLMLVYLFSAWPRPVWIARL